MKCLILILTIILSTSVGAQEYGRRVMDASAYMAELKASSEQVTAIEADFEMHKRVVMMKDVNVSKGRFSYDKSRQCMVLDYMQPKDNKVIVEGDNFTITMNGKTSTMTSRDNPAMSQLGAMITACMTGNFVVLCERSETLYYTDDKLFTMVIKPLNKRVQRYMSEIVLRFETADRTMSVMRITEKSGDYTEYIFSNKQIK